MFHRFQVFQASLVNLVAVGKVEVNRAPENLVQAADSREVEVDKTIMTILTSRRS